MTKETKPSFRPDFVVHGCDIFKGFPFSLFFLSVFYYRTPHPHLLKTRPVSIVLSICMFYINGETCLKTPPLFPLTPSFPHLPSLSPSFTRSSHLTFDWNKRN